MKSRGAQVYIASSVVEPMIEPFAARIGAQTIGTPVEYGDGRVRVAGELVAQERKIEQVLSLADILEIRDRMVGIGSGRLRCCALGNQARSTCAVDRLT